MTKRSGFFTLPRELRDSIYRNLLVVGTINIASLPVAWLDTGEHINPERSAWRGISFVKLDDKDPMDCAMRWADSSVPLNTDYTLETYVITEDSPKPDLDVTRVCKQIFHESTEIFFTENVFCFRACWDNKDDRFPILTPATVVAAKFLEDRRPSARQHIRSLELHLDLIGGNIVMGQMRSPVSWDRDSREEQARWSDTIRDLWKTLKTMNTQTLSIFLLEKSCHSNFDTETGAGDLLHETGWMNQLRTLTTLRHLSVNMLIVAAAAAGWYTRSWGVECEIFESLEDRELPVVHADEGIFPNQSVNDLVEAVKTVMMKVAPASIRQGVEFQGPHGGITVHYTVRLTHWQTALVDLTGINRHYLWLALSSDGKKQIPDVCKVPEKSDNDRPVLRLRDQNTIRADLVQSLAPSGEPCDAWLTAQFNTS